MGRKSHGNRVSSTRTQTKSQASRQKARRQQVHQEDGSFKRENSSYQNKEMHQQGAFSGFKVVPKTENQAVLIEAIEHSTIVVALGPAGTGKTYVSVGKAAQLFNSGGFEQIILARSIIPTGKSMGYLPGDVTEKLVPWVLPMLSVLEKSFGKTKFEFMLAKGVIEIQPLETIRGRSFENSIILVDEAQNLDMEELKAITTRLGEGSKLILMGDALQSDIQGRSPLLRFADMCERYKIDIPVVSFGVEDIVRSDIVADLVKMFVSDGAMRFRSDEDERIQRPRD